MMHREPPPVQTHVYYNRVIYCAGCGYAVENEMAKLDDRIFHVRCFVCHHCKQSLVGKEVRQEDNKCFDEECFVAFGSNRCDICKIPILGDNETYVKAKGKTYHDNCYVCSQCGSTLRKKRYVMDGENRLCQPCVAANRLAPHQPVEPPVDESMMSEEL